MGCFTLVGGEVKLPLVLNGGGLQLSGQRNFMEDGFMKWAFAGICLIAFFGTAIGWAEEGNNRRPNLTDEQKQRILERFDANGDGKLDGKERHAARKARILKKFDANGDGTLDANEKDAAREAHREFKQKNGNNQDKRKKNAGKI